jgi:homocysteine S-methyltransferase
MLSSMNPLQAILDAQGFVMLDGGLATEMERRGADLDHFLWSARMLAEAPELVRMVHHDYLRAGADVIATATYQASFDGFERAGFDRPEAERLMRLAVELAIEARDAFWADAENRSGRQRPLVAASIGPYGACLHDGSEYHGNYAVGANEVRDFHRPRLDLLADTGAELLAFETIPSRAEAEVLTELLTGFPEHAAWLSFSCRDGERVCHGERFADCAALADASAQIAAVGINCTPPEHVPALLESAQGLRTPLMAYPNSGEHWVAAANRWEGQGCDLLTAAAWYRRGARIVGGCCRTGPEDIRRMRAELETLLRTETRT